MQTNVSSRRSVGVDVKAEYAHKQLLLTRGGAGAHMNLYHWLVGCFSKRRKSLAFKHGMVNARRRNHQAAIDDYSSVIGVSGVPDDVKAMALYNRALAYATIEDICQAAEDLNEVLGMPNAPAQIKTEAVRKLARMQQRADRAEQRTASHE